jgi:hypothetical protein
MRLSILAAAILLGLLLNVGSTSAAEKATTKTTTTVSDNALADLGLAGLEQVSDAEGMEIRGKGWGHHHHHHHHHGHHGHHGHHHHGHKHKHKHHKW